MKNSILHALLYFALFSLASCESSPKEAVKKEEDAAKEIVDNVPTVNEASSFIYGLDLSKFQGDEIENLGNYKDKLSFIICKATEGVTYTDPKFAYNWKMIPKLGFIRGAYHFYRTQDKPIPQAKSFVRAINDLKATDIPPIVDFEEASFRHGDVKIEDVQKDLLVFLKTVEQELQRKPMIYIDDNIGNKYLNLPEFGEYALWIANYEAKTKPLLPKAWRGGKWLFWQKTGSYILDGNKNDFDTFNGSKEDLAAFIASY